MSRRRRQWWRRSLPTAGRRWPSTPTFRRTVTPARIAAATQDAFGGIDILFNNAAVQTYGSVWELPEEAWDRTIAVNLKSIYLVSRHCIPVMMERGGGSIINTASVQGLASQRNVAAYAAAKGGVISLTRNMALDLGGHNIRVNSVLPRRD